MLKTLFYSYFWLTAIANDGKFIKPGLSFDGVAPQQLGGGTAVITIKVQIMMEY